MWRLAMRIYEWLSARPAAKWWILSATLLLLTLPLINLQYKENIAEFIPQSGNYLERMEVFQQMSSADKTFVLFSIKEEAQEQKVPLFAEEQKAPLDAQEQNAPLLAGEENAPLLAEAVDLFAERLAAADSSHLVKEIVKEVDYERYKALIPFIYSHIPYLLSAEDIAKTDSLLSTPGFIEERLMERSAELMLPTGSFLSSSFEWDPLGLFSSVAETQLSTSSIPNCALYNGHIFTPDWRYALCIIASEGDPNESSTNKRLINLIEQAAKIDGITAEHIGAPSIAVGNATRIKRDSILALSLALLLITILLHFTLKSLRDLLLIVATLAFGWLCGLSAVALAEQSVSMIVVGIASIILGIAANYPLHLITHTYHCRGRVGESLRQVVSPLITGNITTVGAFCALIPLNSPALRDLGIFAAAMLVGTILFTIVILPHLIKHKASSSAPQTCTPDASAPYSSALNASAPASGITAACRRANVWKRAQTPLIIAATLATLVLGYFGASTRFNPNLQEINYMTQRQRELMQQLSSLADLPSGRETLYIYNSNAAGELAGTPAREAAAVPARMPADTNECLLQGAESIYEALIGMPELRNAGAEVSSIAQIVPSKRSQQQRLEAWGRLMERHRQNLAERLPKAAESAGFAGNAFSNFFSVIEKEYEIIEPTSFAQLLAGRGASMFKEGERCVTTVTLPQEAGDSLQSLISSKVAGLFEGSGQRVSLFNVKELSSAISESLSADFNYIGLSCSLIVFIFLWLSLRRLSYAIIAFMPMVVSWIWILGIMNLFGIEFNLVNIILATFIFGQGDDYSIFITEGLIYEDKYGKKIIGSFRESIYISAAIMFIGMGTLIVAKHPALSSLGEITVLGMAAVVLFSCTLPPLLFRLFRRVGIIRSAGIVKGV